MISTFIVCLIASTGTAEEKGQALARELAQKNAGYRDLVGNVEMVLTDADGSEARRTFSLKVLERASASEGDRSLIVFEAPADVKGTAVLSHGSADGQDEQWLYMPSAKRTRRISSSNRTGAFVGSEFSFEDLTGNDGRRYTWRHLGEKPCGASTCAELEATPKAEESAYSRRVLTLDTKELRVLSVAFFDRKGELLKTLAYDEFKQVGEKQVRPQRWVMSNAQTGKKTTLKFVAMKTATGLTATDFATGKLGQ
ncbi:MAG: outer membrane lipoprotein-sorting protein [Myxococcaceae bacterium]|nr:outer membrane lipoprotein-sorting protein [Myxococcaceae bacterium]